MGGILNWPLRLEAGHSQIVCRQPSFYAYKTLNHSGTFADEIKNTEANFDKHLENIRRINEANRSINEFRQNSTANSSFSPEIAKSLIIQTASNLFPGIAIAMTATAHLIREYDSNNVR